MNKRKIIALIIFLGGLIFLTGCLRMRSNYTINRDGSGNLEVISAMTTDFYELAKLEGEDPFAEIKSVADKEGYEIKEYEAERYSGFKLITDFSDMSELEELKKDDILFDLNGDIDVDAIETGPKISKDESIFQTTYSYQDEINLSDIDDELEDEEMAMGMQAFLQEGIDMGVEFNLPVEPLEHNAAVVDNDGKRLVWDFYIGEEQKVFFEMRVLNRRNIAIISSILLLLAIASYKLLKKDKTKDYNRHLEI